MEIKFEGCVSMTLDWQQGTKPLLKEVSILLNTQDPLVNDAYHDNDLPNEEGVKVLSNLFVQGLGTLIKHAHQAGYRDESDHLRYIIAELQRVFVENAEVGTGHYPDDHK